MHDYLSAIAIFVVNARFAHALSCQGRLKSEQDSALLHAIDNRTLGKGSIAGDEYLHNMHQARVNDQGVATWSRPASAIRDEERPYWEEYFELLSTKDAHSRHTCRHENGTDLWDCCDCTKKPERYLAAQGSSFLKLLEAQNRRSE